MVKRLRSPIALGAALALVLATVALAVVYSWSTPAVVGGNNQFATWMNGVHELGVTVDDTVSPSITYTHFVYVSDYALDGTYTNDTKCTDQNDCLANYYMRSTNGGRTFGNPVKLPQPNRTPADRVTLAVTGKTLIAAYMTQQSYYQGGSTFDEADPRFVYVTRNTNHGSGDWSQQQRLPGQTDTSRGDYLNIWASGSNVHLVTTNTQNGNIWYWRSTDRGATWSNPVTIGATTAVDNVSGYVGGFSGLPSVAASGNHVIVSYIDNPTGRVVYVRSTNGGASFGAEVQLAASGGNANNGYVNMDARGTRIAVTWTTAGGGFLKIYNTGTGTFGATRQFVSFPDTDPGIGSTYNKGGEGAMVALGPGDLVGIALSECNLLATGNICNDPDLLNNKTREQLVWRSSEDNGATWDDPQVIGPVRNAKTTLMNNYGDAIYVKTKPLVIWNGHDAIYFNYVNYRTVGTP